MPVSLRSMNLVSRPVCALIALGLLAACAGPMPDSTPSALAQAAYVPAEYQARQDGEYTIPAVNLSYLVDRNRRQIVPYTGPEPVGTIVIDPYARFLYYVISEGQAQRYGIAVGREGKGFSGVAQIQRKQEYPSWTPTANMVRTEPELYGPLAGGLPGGLDNPLGARALYLYKNGRDTYYRIHGTMDPGSIGRATSAGCIRLFNQDIIDLFDAVPKGTLVKVRNREESLQMEGPVVELHSGYVVAATDQAAIEEDRRLWEAGLIEDWSVQAQAQYEASVELAEQAGTGG